MIFTHQALDKVFLHFEELMIKLNFYLQALNFV